jgi:large subunit ribosomal protein L6
MSRIGKLPIPLASGVDVKIADGVVSVKGPKGQLQQALVANVSIELADGKAHVKRDADHKQARAMQGLMRSLLANMVTGVTAGFQRDLEIHGVGYRAEMKGKDLVLSVGYSHPVTMPVPQGLDVSVESPTKLSIKGADKQRVGQFAAEVRKVRSPEPYKGKGIRYAGEHVRHKVGKAAVGA